MAIAEQDGLFTESMIGFSLNSDSLQRIKTIENGFRSFPAYAAYAIRNYCYDMSAGIQALEITKNGNPVNLFLFYPDSRGKIGSIALYGEICIVTIMLCVVL